MFVIGQGYHNNGYITTAGFWAGVRIKQRNPKFTDCSPTNWACVQFQESKNPCTGAHMMAVALSALSN